MNLYRKNLLLALVLVASCAGCALSLHSLFTPKDIISDPAIFGLWREEKNGLVWRIWNSPGVSTMLAAEDSPHSLFFATLGVVGKQRFLQICPDRPDAVHQKTFFGAHFIPCCSFFKCSMDKDTLRLVPLNILWLVEMDKQNKLDIKHERLDSGMILLTAPTQDLQKFVLKYADNTNAFSEVATFKRQVEKPAPAVPLK